MILKFALTETFSANICNICITSRHLFNHNKFSKSLSDSDNIIGVCKDIEYAEFINNDVGHVVTDGYRTLLRIPNFIRLSYLRDLLSHMLVV